MIEVERVKGETTAGLAASTADLAAPLVIAILDKRLMM